MCKLLLITGITEGLVVEEFMKRMAVPMSRSNNDGIGYTGVNPDGSLFSEKWFNNEHFMSTDNVLTPEIIKQLEPYRKRLPSGALNPNYQALGTPNFKDVKTITMHTRFATCEKGIHNTHPFIYDDTSLVHNGVIRNAHYLNLNKISTCDSEAALQSYIEQGVAADTSKAAKWLDVLSGGWAFGVLAKNAQGNRILDVVRGSSMLYYMEIDGIGKVFTTNDDDAVGVVKDMGLQFIKEPGLMKFDSMYRFDAVTGEYLEEVKVNKTWTNPHYNNGWSGGNYTGAKGGGTTTTSGESKPQKEAGQKKVTAKDRHYNLCVLLGGMAGTGDSDCVPDVLLSGSTWDNPRFDSKKVSEYCSTITEPLIDRLDIFDLAHGTDYSDIFERLGKEAREFVEETDEIQGIKAVRQLLKTLDKSMKLVAE